MEYTGQVIRGYEIKAHLGAGGFGAVYRAFQPVVGREVAIKVILPAYANQPEFIRKFESEAQLAARLEHPHIVPLYDYWREPDGAYLVMRYLRGGNLRAELKNGPWDSLRVSHMLDQIASALDAAHRYGVVHRDVKPDNILLDEEGNSYLADFGIAKLLKPIASAQDDDNMLTGSLGYISPEQTTGAEITSRSDIYSLGVVVFEMLAGEHPFSEYSPSMQMIKHMTEPLPSILTLLPNLPAALDDVIQRATAKDPEWRFIDAASFARAFREAFSGPGEIAAYAGFGAAVMPAPLELVNPYKGLHPFEESDANDFFGREALAHRLLDRLERPTTKTIVSGTSESPYRFLAVIGPSGSGKSSVVKAGLLPFIRRGMIVGSDQWLVAEMVPGADPFREIESALLRVAARPVENLLQRLKTESGVLAQILPALLPDSSDLVLVIDQFEEIFTQLANEAERAQFLDVLYSAVTARFSRIRLIITLRADFYDRPLMYAGFGSLVQQCTEVVLPLSPGELEQAIIGPAERVGVSFERGLPAEIASQVREQPGALPLLQYALTELFERREGTQLTRAAFQQLGGVTGALARRAEEIYRSLKNDERAAAELVFPRLVTLGEGTEDTRRRVLLNEIEPLSPLVGRVVELYGRMRLLSFDRDPVSRAPTVEVAHEALIREWATLREWLNQNREGLRIQRHITQVALEWVNDNRAADDLYRGARLVQAREWLQTHPDAFNPLEKEFLAESLEQALREESDREAQHQRELESARRLADAEKARAEEQAQATLRLQRRGRWLAIALLIAVLMMAAAAGLGVVASRARDAAQANFTNSEKLRLAAQANSLLLAGTNIEAAPLLGIQSLKLGYSPEADAVLQRAMTFPFPARKLKHEFSIFALDYSPDGKWIATAASDDNAYLWDASTGELVRTFSGHTDVVQGLAFSPDGRFLATCGSDLTIRIWDAATGETVKVLEGHTEQIWTVVFSPDGQRLLSSSYDQTVRIWDFASGEQVGQVDLPETTSGAVFSPDGRYILAACDCNSAILYDAETFEQVREYGGHKLPVVVVAFSHDGRYLATGSNDKTARVYDVASGEEINRFVGHMEGVYDVAFSPDDHSLLTAGYDRQSILWDIDSGSLTRRFSGHEGSLYSAEFSPDGLWVATASFDQHVFIWPSGLGPDPRRLDHNSAALAVAISGDGKLVLTGDTKGLGHVWESATGRELQPLIGHAFDIDSVAFSSDAKLAATTGSDGTIIVWDTATGEQVQVLGSGEYAQWVVRFSPDGRHLLAGGDDYTATLWDIQTGEKVHEFVTEGAIYALAFSSDGKLAFSGNDAHFIQAWDTATGQEVSRIDASSSIFALALTPDNRYAISAGKTLGLYELATGKLVREYAGHSGSIFSMAVSPDGQSILSGGEDGTARLWDLETGEPVRVFSGQQGIVYGVVFTPDGKQAWIASADNSVMLWDVAVRGLTAHACSRLTRDLTPDERAKYNIQGAAPSCPAK